jgi:hypothetical protein
MERDWVFGNVVCIYCHWLFCFVFETVREEVVYLSAFLAYLELDCCFGHCVRAFCLSIYMSILHCCPLPGRAMHSSDCHHGNELKQCQQRLIIVESSLWPQVVCRLFSKIFRCWLIVSAVMIATCVRAFLLED